MESFTFVSHASADKDLANRLVAFLEGSGLRCWLASRDVAPDLTHEGAVSQAIGQCNCLVLIYSSEAGYSSDVTNQTAAAFKAGKAVIPILAERVISSEATAFADLIGAVTRLTGVVPAPRSETPTPAPQTAPTTLVPPVTVAAPPVVLDSPLERLRKTDLGSAVIIESYLSQGNKLGAIKVYRQATGVGLKEAKDAIDATCMMNPTQFPASYPGRGGCASAVVGIVLFIGLLLAFSY